MAEFDVTLSALESASNNIKNYTQQYREEANEVYQAAQRLSESWEGDASEEFLTNMEQLHQWMERMAECLDTYSADLAQAKEKYGTADVNSAGFFKK